MFLFIKFAVILASVYFDSGSNPERDLLNKGYKLIEANQVTEALNLWESAFTELNEPSFLIGSEYIRYATEAGLKDQYKIGSSMYLWGLGIDHISDSNAEVFQKELDFLKPIIDEEKHKKWRELFKEKDPSLLTEIYDYWRSVDPTPETNLYNERLLEHWERIAYSRKIFTENDNSVYETDDRGIVYVKFGKPDKIEKGKLTATRADAFRLCRRFTQECDEEQMSAALLDLFTNPTYEIWIYEDELKYNDNLVFLFGESLQNKFSKLKSLEDFIQPAAFSNGIRYDWASFTPDLDINSISPGMVFQYLYYEQLSWVDGFFSRRFNQINFDMMGNPDRIGRYLGFTNKMLSQQETRMMENAAPDEFSSFDRSVFAINLDAHHYRFLDDENNTVIISFVESYPGMTAVQDYIHNSQFYTTKSSNVDTLAIQEDYKLLHGIRVLNADNLLMYQNLVKSNLIIDTSNEYPSSAVFTIPNKSSEKLQVVLSAQLFNSNDKTSPRVDTPFDNSVRGLGRLVQELPEAIEISKNELEISDIVFGYQFNDQAGEDILFPFVVSHEREIPVNEALAVHLEIYNLTLNQDKISEFSIDYMVTEDKGIRIFRKREPKASLSLNLVHDGTRFTEDFEIQTRELRPGKYNLQLSITDKSTNRRISKKIPFKVKAEKSND